MKNMVRFVFVVCIVACYASAMVWDAQHGLDGWKAHENLRCHFDGTALVLTDIRRDAQLISPLLNINPKSFNHISFRYRASQTGRAGGQVFYAVAPGKFKGRKCWIIPRLIADGQWHTMLLTPKNLSNPKDWMEGGNIRQLRLDPTDSPGGKIEISEIRLFYQKFDLPPQLPPLPQVKLQLDEPHWEPVKVSCRQRMQVCRGSHYFKGKLIYSPEDQRGKGAYTSFYLRRSFQLKDKPIQAWLQYIADDRADAYLNGQQVGTATSWKTATVAEVTDMLQPGKNVLGFHYSNTWSAGGVMAELFVRYPDGTMAYVDTDGEFKTSVTAPADWPMPTFKDTDWKGVLMREGPPSAPWTHRVDYCDFAYVQQVLDARCSKEHVKAGETIALAFDFEGSCPNTPTDVGIILMDGQHLLWDEVVRVTDKQIRRGAGKRWSLTLDYRLPECLNTHQVTLTLTAPVLVCPGEKQPKVQFELTRVDRIAGALKPLVARMSQTSYGPTLMVNDKPCFPLWGGVSTASRADKRPHHGDAPLNIVTLWSEATQFWPDLDTLNTDHFDYVAEKHLREHPDALFVWALSMMPPQEWAQKYPDEMCQDEKGNRDLGYGRVTFSFASPQIRKDFLRIIPKLIDYLEQSPYANKIVGYRIDGGHTTEWIGWEPRKGHCVDFSPAVTRAFAAFAKEHYPQLKHPVVPSLGSRYAQDSKTIIWNPEQNMNVIAYHDFYSQSVANLLAACCQCARKQVGGRKIIGTYYGYTATMNSGGAAHMRGHFALQKVLDAQVVDFLTSPQPYNIRKLGDTNGDMKPFASLNNRGVMAVIEDDTRTHAMPYLNFGNNYQTLNLEQSIAVLRRNVGILTCRNQPAYFYAMCYGTEFDFPEAAETLASCRVANQHAIEHGVTRQAEIAVVFSEKSIVSLPQTRGVYPSELAQTYDRQGQVKTQPVFGSLQAFETFNGNLRRMGRMGAPVDYLLAEDLKNQKKTYKLYVFANCFRYDEEFLKAVQTLRQRDTTLVWLYAPGCMKGVHMQESFMKELTGLTLKRLTIPSMPAVRMKDGRWMGTTATRITPMFAVLPEPDIRPLATYEDGSIGLAMRQTGKAQSYFVGTYHVDLPFLMWLAYEAGVHVFSDSTDPLEANSQFVTLHARFPGTKTIRLTREADVLDVFNRRIIASKTRQFTFQAPLHSSWLFYIGPQADSLLKKLQQQCPTQKVH